MSKRDEAANAAMDLPVAHRDNGPEAEPEREKRERNMGEIRCAKITDLGYLALVAGTFDEVRGAERWLRENGEDGGEYVVLRLVGRHRVAVETTIKRTVTEIRP